jgi:L-ascorbate metabolism protein UlaG (beta-lactamase superfamily)
MFTFQDVQIGWYGQDAFKVIGGGKTIWMDPFKIPDGVEKADILLITHDHFDHYNAEDVAKVVGEQTITVSPFEAETPSGERKLLKVGETTEIDGIKIEAVAAYNVDKRNEEGEHFHPKADERCGFIVTVGETRLYHAGDTDPIPEMEQIKADIALIPVSGTYVMNSEEAVKAVDQMQPKVAIPMHYGGMVGKQEDADHLKENSAVAVEILAPETK